uniref:Uncharacterized protein n=1 Tax=Haemonchus placei TaxID=6290 RepID=A0A0N4VVF2_HAEPC
MIITHNHFITEFFLPTISVFLAFSREISVSILVKSRFEFVSSC